MIVITRISNHEVWEKCPICNATYDLRTDSYCTICKEPPKSTRPWNTEQ